MKSFIVLFLVCTACTTEANKPKGEQAARTEEERELQFWTPPGGKGLLGKGIGKGIGKGVVVAKGVVDDGKGVVGKGIEEEACPPLRYQLSGVDCTTPGKECEGNGIICHDGSVLPTEYCTCVEIEETGMYEYGECVLAIAYCPDEPEGKGVPEGKGAVDGKGVPQGKGTRFWSWSGGFSSSSFSSGFSSSGKGIGGKGFGKGVVVGKGFGKGITGKGWGWRRQLEQTE
eukprot:CAMPEP_0178932194 /NCGR_PEP_ID=MMETSP0786-20121207/22441_1 /TAXON_ID=186022 /ORGANISM="Thalassionema frauenfeldii, Strain CCMP 1798" /LENGTH=228 /DNA_ID=CAMNT_0020609377 /DNA_START=402 /DNA_END=1088 /DNA_ORIENTATION=-